MKIKVNDKDPVNSDDNYAPPGVVSCKDGKCMKQECLTCNPKNVQEEIDMSLGMGDVHTPAPIGNPKKEKKFGGPGSGRYPEGSSGNDDDDDEEGSGISRDSVRDRATAGNGSETSEGGINVGDEVKIGAAYGGGKGTVLGISGQRNNYLIVEKSDGSIETHHEGNVDTGSNKFSEEQEELDFAELNMEVFATGTWNGDKYTDDDLNNIVKSYNAIGERVKPYLKLGHNEEQKLAKDSGFFKDGRPSLGWVGSLRKVGGKLVATFKDVPQVVAELVNKKAYKRVSSEIYTNYKMGDTVYPFVLKAVALLGADTPAVTTLHDVAAMYTEDTENTFREVTFSKDFTNEEVKKMSIENEVDLEKQFAEKEEALRKEYADKSAKMDEILAMFEGVDDLKKAVVEFKAKEQDVSAKQKEYTEHLERVKKEEVKKFVSDLVNAEKMLPAQARLAEGILLGLGAAESTELKFVDAKMYGYKDKMSLYESIQKFMSSFPKFGLLKEYTSQKKLFTDKNAESEELVKQYMDEHKVDYGAAQLAVYSARPELFGLKLELTGDEPEDSQD